MAELERIVYRLVSGLQWVQNNPTCLLDKNLLEALNYAPGCEDCYNDALCVVCKLEEEAEKASKKTTEKPPRDDFFDDDLPW